MPSSAKPIPYALAKVAGLAPLLPGALSIRVAAFLRLLGVRVPIALVALVEKLRKGSRDRTKKRKIAPRDLRGGLHRCVEPRPRFTELWPAENKIAL